MQFPSYDDETRKRISQFLDYNTKVYDNDYYPRALRSRKLAKLSPEYEKIKMPKLIICGNQEVGDPFNSLGGQQAEVNTEPTEEYVDDLDIGETQIVVETDVPPEVRIFYHEYIHKPNMRIKVYKPAFLQYLCERQRSTLRQHLYEGGDIDNAIFLLPICRVRENFEQIGQNDDDLIRTHVLCYVNPISQNIEAQLPSPNERYMIVTIELKQRGKEKPKHRPILEDMTFDLNRSVECVLEELQCLPDTLNSLREKLCDSNYI